MSQWKLLEFCCPVHGRFELTVERATDPDAAPCPALDEDLYDWKQGGPLCGISSPWCISAPMVRKLTIKVQAVTTAKSDDRPPGMLDTRGLGLNGQSMREWNAKHDAADRERRHQWIKKNIG